MQTIFIENANLHFGGAPLTSLLGLRLAGETKEPAPRPPADAPASAPPASSENLTPPALGEYWQGQGGILVSTVPAMLGLPARHIIVSTEEVRRKYGPYVDVPGAKSHTDGPGNTAALLAQTEAHPAAQWAANYTADGHKDFHLASRFDMLMAFLQSPGTFNTDGWYATSTQDDRGGAFAQVFAIGDSLWLVKDYEFRVRAVRWIQL